MTRLPRCPQCKGSPSAYRELQLTSMDFNLTNGRFDQSYFNETEQRFNKGFSHPTEPDVDIDWELSDLNPTGKIEATCGNCGHGWILRKFKRIDELIELHGYNKSK